MLLFLVLRAERNIPTSLQRKPQKLVTYPSAVFVLLYGHIFHEGLFKTLSKNELIASFQTNKQKKIEHFAWALHDIFQVYICF